MTPPSADPADAPLSAAWLLDLCRRCGADDAGFVEIGRPAIADEKPHLERLLPGVRTVISIVVRMNREPVRAPDRSVANLEFHATGSDTDEVARRIVRALGEAGIGACNPPMAFPMEMSRFPERMWVVAHKPIAVAAGMGRQGIHRNVIHPRFGNFILLGSIAIDRPVDRCGEPLELNPCLECKLCVAVCPVGAIAPSGAFDFSACYHHNYHEFVGGFAAFLETVADSRDGADLGHRLTRNEAISMWQSLSYGPNYQSGYCIAACPAGEDVISPFLKDRNGFVKRVVRPLQQGEETVFVVPGSDAESHVRKRYPHKRTKTVRNTLVPRTVQGFLAGLPIVFQRQAAGDLDATYHFTFTGAASATATVVIRDRTIAVRPGHDGAADVAVVADSGAWIACIDGSASVVWAIVRRTVRVRGPLRLLRAFQRCFPG